MKDGSMRIHVAKNILHRCVEIIENLENLKQSMSQNVETMSRLEWKEKTQEIGKEKDELGCLMSRFDSDVIVELNKKLAKRKQKRAAIRRRKDDLKFRREQEFEEMKEQERVIDERLEEERKHIEIEQEEENFKKDADCVLAEVRRFKLEARKQISLLTALIKLRSTREKLADGCGTTLIPEHKALFLSTTEQLLALWNNAIDKYTNEENYLNDMLNKKKLQNDKRRIEAEQVIDEWERILFGPKYIPNERFYRELNIAENDLRSFIAVRKSWDTFVSDLEGSCIPVGWILPNEKPSKEWKQFLIVDSN